MLQEPTGPFPPLPLFIVYRPIFIKIFLEEDTSICNMALSHLYSFLASAFTLSMKKSNPEQRQLTTFFSLTNRTFLP